MLTVSAGYVDRRKLISNAGSRFLNPKAQIHAEETEVGSDATPDYESLLDSGVVRTRSELARYVGVSRANVTPVLRRLELPKTRNGKEDAKTT